MVFFWPFKVVHFSLLFLAWFLKRSWMQFSSSFLYMLIEYRGAFLSSGCFQDFFYLWLSIFRKWYAAAAKSHQSCLILCDGSPPGSSVPGILQARILEWVAIFFFNACMHAKLLQLYLTLCDPIDGSPPGSSVPGILQARILEWVRVASELYWLNL